jgi:hypothetical protein
MKSTIKRHAARIATAAVLGGAALAGAGSAHADSTGYSIDWLGTQYWIVPTYDLLNVAVSQGSYSVGAQIIQWYNDGGSEQKWVFGDVFWGGQFIGYEIKNVNSGLCLETSGSAGATLYQNECYPNDLGEVYAVTQNDAGADLFQNVGTGLYLDVSGYSWGAGAQMDLWYNNGQPNQQFFLEAL